jgi:hypothetical protein
MIAFSQVQALQGTPIIQFGGRRLCALILGAVLTMGQHPNTFNPMMSSSNRFYLSRFFLLRVKNCG